MCPEWLNSWLGKKRSTGTTQHGWNIAKPLIRSSFLLSWLLFGPHKWSKMNKCMESYVFVMVIQIYDNNDINPVVFHLSNICTCIMLN